MNKLELAVYNVVKDNPKLKQKIVDAYQIILGFVPQKSFQCNYPSVQRPGYFFGFHDKSPFSADGKLLLAHGPLKKDNRVLPGEKINVGFFSESGWTKYQKVGETDAWNWQLGSMLQWKGSAVVYNTIINNDVRSKVVDLNGSVTAEYAYPIVHVSSDGCYASSYDFIRIEAAMPGYGAVLHTPHLDDKKRNSFRIFRCADGKVTFELSLEEAMSISPQPSMMGAFHFFHHSLFNPSSDRTFFLHRWVDKNERRWTRMFSVGITGEDLYLFPMDEMVSHITWADSERVFAYARMPGKGDGYHLITDRIGESTQFFENVLNSDGHPTYDVARKIIITDTYPDRFRNQFLVLGLAETQQRINIARLHLPRKFRKELQVDLHPRLHPLQFVACIDTGHAGTRSLLTIDFRDAMP